MHDVVQIVYSEATILSCFAGDTPQKIVSVTTWFVPALSGEEASYQKVRFKL